MFELHYFKHEKLEVLRFYTTAELVKHLAKLISAVNAGVFNLLWNSQQKFFLQQYDSYEDAYAAALYMREPNPKCYAPLS
jgi:hypothetical protein